MIYQPLLETDALSEDAKNRCRQLIENCNSPPGAYTGNSKGWVHVRQSVVDFIHRRDGTSDSDVDKVYMTNGASEAVRLAFTSLIRNSNDGVLIPIP
jgi:aspartate/methionine/tyrosine aminotransferase